MNQKGGPSITAKQPPKETYNSKKAKTSFFRCSGSCWTAPLKFECGLGTKAFYKEILALGGWPGDLRFSGPDKFQVSRFQRLSSEAISRQQLYSTASPRICITRFLFTIPGGPPEIDSPEYFPDCFFTIPEKPR